MTTPGTTSSPSAPPPLWRFARRRRCPRLADPEPRRRCSLDRRLRRLGCGNTHRSTSGRVRTAAPAEPTRLIPRRRHQTAQRPPLTAAAPCSAAPQMPPGIAGSTQPPPASLAARPRPSGPPPAARLRKFAAGRCEEEEEEGVFGVALRLAAIPGPAAGAHVPARGRAAATAQGRPDSRPLPCPRSARELMPACSSPSRPSSPGAGYFRPGAEVS